MGVRMGKAPTVVADGTSAKLLVAFIVYVVGLVCTVLSWFYFFPADASPALFGIFYLGCAVLSFGAVWTGWVFGRMPKREDV